MDPLEPWIDAAAVRRLAENLLTESRAPQVADLPDTGFGNDFVGFAAAPATPPNAPVESAPQPPDLPVVHSEAEPRVFEPVMEAPLPVAEVPAPPPPADADLPGRGPLLARLARFRDILVRHTGALGVFIIDREGKPVMEDAAFTRLHFLARSLAQASRPASGQPTNVHVKIGANEVLEVIPVDTPFGRLVLGAVVPRPFAATLVSEISVALAKAATPEVS